MSDYSELKRLAEAALNDNGDYVALNDYGMAVPPAVVLGLIEEYERVCALNHSQFGDAIRGNAERDHLKAENEALRKDSDRYQWLRDKSEAVHQFYLSTPIWFTGMKFNKKNVDSTIDAAMGKGGQS